MTTHAAILEQLEKYEDGAFVPQYTYHRGTFILRHVAESDLLNYWCEACDDDEPMPEELTHRDIERAAFRAVWHWCKERGYLLCVHECDGQYWCRALDGHELFYITHAPDEPAMWLAAVKYINGEQG